MEPRRDQGRPSAQGWTMTRISTGSKKSGAPAHANRFAYVHNRNSRLTRQILASPISGVCPSCVAVLEWRKKFRKYKPLSVPKKCVKCGLKNIKDAYHVICTHCARQQKVCAKCLQPRLENEQPLSAEALEVLLKRDCTKEECAAMTGEAEEMGDTGEVEEASFADPTSDPLSS